MKIMALPNGHESDKKLGKKPFWCKIGIHSWGQRLKGCTWFCELCGHASTPEDREKNRSY